MTKTEISCTNPNNKFIKVNANLTNEKLQLKMNDNKLPCDPFICDPLL